MELYRLKSFLAILHEGNLTRAADRLHLSQSALSSQLRQLEEELGVALFRRTSRGMAATETARELQPLAEAVLAAVNHLEERAAQLSRSGEESLTIGLNTDPAFLRVGAVNRRLALLHEELNVIFVASQSVRMPLLLSQGQIDLGFFYGNLEDPSIRCLRLAEVRFCVVLPDSLRRGHAPLDWAEVAALPWIWVEQDSPPYAALRGEFDRRGLTPSVAVQAVDEYIVKELFASGQGVALLREDEARPLLAAGTAVIWEKGWKSLPLQLGWLARHDASRRIRSARTAIEYLWQQRDPMADDSLARLIY